MRLHGFIAGRTYHLDIAHQPTVNPDRLTVGVKATSGWHGAASLAGEQAVNEQVTATFRA